MAGDSSGPVSSEERLPAVDEQFPARKGQGYWAPYEFMTGSPLVLMPEKYTKLRADILARAEPMILSGIRSTYGGVPVFAIERIRPPREGRNAEGDLGIMVASKGSELPRHTARRVRTQPHQIVLVSSNLGPPAAFLIRPDGEPQWCGLFLYRLEDTHDAQSESEAPTIAITMDELERQNTTGQAIADDALDISLVSEIGLPYPHPVPCAYCGQRITNPAEACIQCGVVLCNACVAASAPGCITVGCEREALRGNW